MKKLVAFLTILVLTTTVSFAQKGKISHFREYDQRGINVFETSKEDDTIKFEGLAVKIGAGFAQQYQSLKHENSAVDNAPDPSGKAGKNQLFALSDGFMTAQANLFLDVQLQEGIRLNVTSYMSARHHNEFWVKGGYIQMDKLPFESAFLDNIMKYTTIRAGHYEINYGDMHFRRSDGGHVSYSPFMEGLIMDAFATEIGGDVFVQNKGFFGMLGITNGQMKGNVDEIKETETNPKAQKQPSIILKGGFDKQLNERLRARLSASWYHNGNDGNGGNTLYGGDRTGSNYQNVMEIVGKDYPSMAFSGRFNPGFSQKIDAVMINGFLKYDGLEFFGTFETASGRKAAEKENRTMTQISVEGIYRFGAREQIFLGTRYNTLTGTLVTGQDDISINRFAIGAGWFLTKNILLKAEYVDQQYKDFQATDSRHGGKFNGLVIQAAVSL